MQETVFDIRKIMELLPHRFPFLLVDRVTSLTEGQNGSRVGVKAEGIKNVTFNEPYFPGHFPELPVMPGVLQIEAMAQLAAISFYRKGDPPMNFLIAGVQDARFRKPVVPGDTLFIEVEVMQRKRSIVKARGRCLVNGEVVSEADMMFGLVDT